MATKRSRQNDFWGGVEDQDYVHKLSSEIMNNFLAKNGSVLVLYYAPWCIHCRKMKPDFASAAGTLSREGSTGKMACLDCVKYPLLSEKLKVQGYPTIRYYRNGAEVTEYKRGRKAQDLIDFMVREQPSNPQERKLTQ